MTYKILILSSPTAVYICVNVRQISSARIGYSCIHRFISMAIYVDILSMTVYGLALPCLMNKLRITIKDHAKADTNDSNVGLENFLKNDELL
jgi:hypothetical protein